MLDIDSHMSLSLPFTTTCVWFQNTDPYVRVMLEKSWLVLCVVRLHRESKVLVVVPNEQSETVEFSCDWTVQQAVVSDDICGVQIV